MVKSLQKLPLRALSLSFTDLDQEGLSGLHALSKLEILNLHHTRVSDGVVSHLPREHLKTLVLSNTTLSDLGARKLATFPALQALYAGNTLLSDKGVRQVATLSKLRELGLSGTRITDAAVPSLVGIETLAYLNVAFTQITSAGAKKIIAAHPDLRIRY